MAWAPQAIATSKRSSGAWTFVAFGTATIVLALVVLSVASWLRALLVQSSVLGSIGAVAIGVGLLSIVYGLKRELTAYRDLRRADHLKATLISSETTLADAQREGPAWLRKVRTSTPEAERAERLLQEATSVAEVRSILRSQMADRLRDAARTLGRRAAIEGAATVAICPHPAWDGMIAGTRGLILVRQVFGPAAGVDGSRNGGTCRDLAKRR